MPDSDTDYWNNNWDLQIIKINFVQNILDIQIN